MTKRIISAIIAAAIFFPLVIIGGMPLRIFIWLIASIAFLELIHMMAIKWFSIESLVGYIIMLCSLFPLEFIQTHHLDNMPTWFSYLSFLALAVITIFKADQFTFPQGAALGSGAMYIGMGFRFLIETRNISLSSIIFVLFVCFANDSFAYFAGVFTGKHKLAPKISPNKTIEGSLGGIAGAVAISVILMLIPYFHDPFPTLQLWQVIIMTIGLAIFGQIGDLLESAVKRYYDVKDSGHILPGHGGILDRFDNLLLVLPMFHYLLMLVI
ncbi:MAG: phosphatidate cytidylyltransferase [Aerococcus sp.]|nr:phosphatidate cytidylyltransferase [Aerococcus sp.]